MFHKREIPRIQRRFVVTLLLQEPFRQPTRVFFFPALNISEDVPPLFCRSTISRSEDVPLFYVQVILHFILSVLLLHLLSKQGEEGKKERGGTFQRKSVRKDHRPSFPVLPCHPTKQVFLQFLVIKQIKIRHIF